jgi:hypothetical protein
MKSKAAKSAVQDKKHQILKDYAGLARSLDRPVKMSDLADIGHTKDSINHHFQSLARLDHTAREQFPNDFSDVSIGSLLGPKALNKLQGAVAKHRRFVITTAITGCKIKEKFYESIKTYCSLKDAALLILAQSDPSHNRSKGGYGYIDKRLADEYLVVADTALNSNFYVSTIKLSAKHINPLTGLGRIGQRNGSFCYASPKQSLQAVPVSNTKLPHFLMTTGAITEPNYTTSEYMAERTARIAEHDHVIGAIVVEIEDDNYYYFRQIQADADGSFVDLGERYTPTFSTAYPADTMVLGDWHSGETDPVAVGVWKEVVELTHPKRLVMHDAFNGLSINHHEEDRLILKAQRAEANQLNLRAEIEALAQDLERLSEWVEEVIMVRSNHDEFLERYLQSGVYVKDSQNHRYALDLAAAMIDGYDPLAWAVERVNVNIGLGKVTWLTRDSDYKIARIQLAHHGDKGANGAKGSLPAMESAYGVSITGHSHCPAILRGAWSVGTSSFLKLSYNVGISSWMQSSILVYPNGARQMIHCIDGRWKI